MSPAANAAAAAVEGRNVSPTGAGEKEIEEAWAHSTRVSTVPVLHTASSPGPSRVLGR